MKIFTIIPVYNRVEFTKQCLESLYQQDTDQFTVIVVDDGSTDGTSEMVRNEFPKAELLEGDGNLWWIGAVNLGISHVLELCQPDDRILLLNDDLIVQKKYISSMIEVARKHKNAIIGSVETTVDAPNIIKSGGIRVNWKTAKRSVLNRGGRLEDFEPGYVVEVSKLTGRGTSFPIIVFNEIGLYDDIHFKQCGDPELPLRANLRSGYQLLVSYDSVVISQVSIKKNINTKEFYSITDWKEFFFGRRSHFNIKDHYWIARNSAPNLFWFLRYFSMETIRLIGHFLLRLRVQRI
jgi:GT2 family glycosyltransferase